MKVDWYYLIKVRRGSKIVVLVEVVVEVQFFWGGGGPQTNWILINLTRLSKGSLFFVLSLIGPIVHYPSNNQTSSHPLQSHPLFLSFFLMTIPYFGFVYIYIYTYILIWRNVTYPSVSRCYSYLSIRFIKFCKLDTN